MPGTVLLLAAAPAGRGCLVDAASVLPVLAAVPPAVLSGADTANAADGPFGAPGTGAGRSSGASASPDDPPAVTQRVQLQNSGCRELVSAPPPDPLGVLPAGQATASACAPPLDPHHANSIPAVLDQGAGQR